MVANTGAVEEVQPDSAMSLMKRVLVLSFLITAAVLALAALSSASAVWGG